MRGVDISHYQKGLTIRQIRDAGNDFVIIKVAEGSHLIDSEAFAFYHEAYELGFPVGCYCYSHATTPEQAQREAEFLLKTINGFPMPCGVFLDVEEQKMLELPTDRLTSVVRSWCGTIGGAGYVPGIYGSEYGLWAKLRPDELPEGTLIWAAHYGREPDMPCDLWQSRDSGVINGYAGAVDTDEARSERFWTRVKDFSSQPWTTEKEKSDPIVMQMQACLRWAGRWPEEVDGICSESFRERLREYAQG